MSAIRFTRAARPVRTVGFWSAVSLPLLHGPLFVSGLSTPDEAALFALLLCLNVVALVLGRTHSRETGGHDHVHRESNTYR